MADFEFETNILKIGFKEKINLFSKWKEIRDELKDFLQNSKTKELHIYDHFRNKWIKNQSNRILPLLLSLSHAPILQ